MPDTKKRPSLDGLFPLLLLRLLSHRDLLLLAKTVLRRLLGDSRRVYHHRNVFTGLSWEQAGDTVVIRISTLFLAGYLTHQAADPVLTRIVRRGREVPRAEAIVQISEVREGRIRRLVRMVALVGTLVDREAVTLAGLTDDLPPSTRRLRRPGPGI